MTSFFFWIPNYFCFGDVSMRVETQWPFLDPGDPGYPDDANEAPKWKEKDIEHQVNSMVS